MRDAKGLIYEFESYQLDPAERRLLHAGVPVQLPPKAFEILSVLVENNGNLVDKETLLNRVWADAFVEEGNLKLNIHTLRKTLHNSNFIETVPKKGYRFNAPVRVISKGKTRELFAEKQTISKITIEATALDEPATKGETKTSVQSFARPKIYLSVMLLLVCMVGLGAFYLWSNSKSRKSAAIPPPLQGVRTIAVLPLKSLSVPPQDQELRVGLADSIVTRLSAVKQLAVRPVSSTIRYLDQNYDAIEAGRELKVDSVLEGSVQKEGQKLLINLQMVGVHDGKVLWAESFSSDLSNALSGQESVAHRVSRVLALNLSSSSPERTGQSSNDPSAQDLYLKGNYALTTSARKIENIFQARDFFEQAIRLDPNFARAHSDLALTYTLAASLNLLSPQETYPKAEKAARRALENDPQSSSAYIALAEIESDYNWNWQAAEVNNKRALELAPNSAAAHHSYSEFLARMGRFNESSYHADLAQQLDPTRINYEAVRALHYFYEHRFDDTIAQSRKVIEKDANAYLAYLYLSVAQAAKGNYGEGIKAGLQAGSLTGGGPSDLFVLGCNYALLNDKAKTDDIVAKMQSMSRQRYVDPFFFVVIYAYRGDKALAFAYIEKSYAERSYWMTSIKVHPVVDSLRADARFAEFLKKMNLDD